MGINPPASATELSAEEADQLNKLYKADPKAPYFKEGMSRADANMLRSSIQQQSQKLIEQKEWRWKAGGWKPCFGILLTGLRQGMPSQVGSSYLATLPATEH